VKELAAELPTFPYRGIHPFRYRDRAIFFARDEETLRLTSLVSVYRGVLLYGDSGSGKSSLVNAGLIPEAIHLGFAPERVRVQPRPAAELVIERIGSSDGEDDDALADEHEAELLPSVLAPGEESAPRTVLAIDAFEERVRAACELRRPLLIFDQFEEIVTLFDEAGAHDVQRRLVKFLVRLLRGSLPVKVLFSFREDYLGRVKELLSACPDLVDQALRIGAPTSDSLQTIIRGPFERYPDRFARPLSPALTSRLVTVLAKRFGTGDVSLSEVQTVCLRLWQSDDPDALLAEKKPQGILEDYLGEALERMPTQLRAAAIVLLAQMVTSAGTRNVISAVDLFQRVQDQEGSFTRGLLDQALMRLSQSRLVRRERRRDLDLYEITSEFLVPWISRRRDALRRSQDRRRERRRLLILTSIVVALLLGVGAIAAFAAQARSAMHQAEAQRNIAISAQVAAESEALASREPRVAPLLAVAAWQIYPTKWARASLLNILAQPDRCVLLAPHRYAPVRSVAFSSDGRELITAGPGGAAWVWDVPRCQHRFAFTFPGTSADSIALSPDGKTLAIALADGKAQLWDIGTRQRDGQPLNAGPGALTGVAFTSDGRTLATADAGGGVRLWEVATHHLIKTLGPGFGRSTGVAFTRDGKTLAAASADGTVGLWHVPDGGWIRGFHASRTGSVNSLVFSADGTTIATGGADGTARLWDVATGQENGAPIQVSALPVLSVAISPDGKTLATAGADGTTRLWNVATREEIGGAPLTIGVIPVYSVAFSPDGKFLATGNDDGTARLWNPSVYHQIATGLTAGRAPAHSIAFSPVAKILATAGTNGTVGLWSAPGGSLIRAFKASRTGAVNSVAFSHDGKTLATGGEDGTARLWNVATGQEMRAPIQVSAKAVLSVAISPDGKTLATGSAAGQARLWDIASGRQESPPISVGAPVRSVTFSPDGSLVATASADGTAQLWEIPSNRRHTANPFRSYLPLESVAFAPHRKILATASDDGSVRLWSYGLHGRTGANRSIGTPLSVGSEIHSVAFTPNGRMLATVSADGMARLWDVATHQQIGAALAAGPGPMTGAAFSSDGTILATASPKSGTRLWNVFLPDNPVAQVCAIAHRPMTLREWRHYVPRSEPFRPVCQR
jgi:WD40 repeat protein